MKSKSLRGGTIYWLVVLIMAAWAMMYLYFVSSSQIPLILPNYDQQLETKEQALRQDLIRTDAPNANVNEGEQTYRLLNRNEICLHDFAAVREHQQAALMHAQNKFLSNRQALTQLYLENANLYREMDKLDLAKINYDQALQNLNKAAFHSDFSLADFRTMSINFNNQAIVYFLLGQKTANTEQKQKYFQLARDCFIHAKNLISVADSSQNKCYAENVDENLKQCLNEIQHSQPSY